MLERFRKTVANFINPTKNAMSLPDQFLRYGNRRTMNPDWSQVSMSDQDFYTGYGYAAIRKNANKVARIAMEHVRTQADDEEFEHPYIDKIRNSKTFSEHRFWRDFSIFEDLEGVYYLMAIRGFAGDLVGEVKEFKMLNPYNIKRVLDGNNLEVAGYIETRKGMQREISKDMIIEVRDLNPFSEDVPFSMADASRESQFTLKTGGEYTRTALKNNINSPGIITTDVILEPEQFANFQERLKKHTKGEPLFSNGPGAVKYESMETDMSKAAIKDIHVTSRESLFAVAGMSKTMMGIEESGTTRETANIQKDINTEDTVMPRIQLMLDALNLDYINHYEKEFSAKKVYVVVDNPLATNHESDLKEAEVKTTKFDLYQSLVNKGYDHDLAAAYVDGEIELEDLGEPTNEPIIETPPTKELVQEDNEVDEVVENQNKGDNVVKQQTGALKNAIVNVEEQLAIAVINHVRGKQKNAYDVVADIISASKKKDAEQEIIAVLTNFYGIVFSLEGVKRMREQSTRLGLIGSFSIGQGISGDIEKLARKVSKSHVDTVLSDLLITTREAALRGDSIDQMVSAIKSKYTGTVVEQRADVIAKTETNRAFTRAQYEADKQFIEQNKLEGRVYKQWRTRGDNPCAFCLALEAEGEVPFDNAFRELGGSIEADGKTLDVNFESLEAGNAHPNCSCDYELIIRSENSLSTMEKEYEEMDKRTKEAKELMEQIQKERAQLDADRAEFDKDLNDLEAFLDE